VLIFLIVLGFIPPLQSLLNFIKTIVCSSNTNLLTNYSFTKPEKTSFLGVKVYPEIFLKYFPHLPFFENSFSLIPKFRGS
jgi:hypothetical protein